jgi:hypothetical protein
MAKNYASALGESIGVMMETAVQKEVSSNLVDVDADLYTNGPLTKDNKFKKLLVKDLGGTDYHVDGVIVDATYRPIVLLESKFLRYTKHNRDKASWICHTHSAIGRAYPSVRSSVAVLAGAWSRPSLKMMQSANVNLFIIQFDEIADCLSKFGVDMNWDEDDASKKFAAWSDFQNLTEVQRLRCGEMMIAGVRSGLADHLSKALDPDAARGIESVTVELRSSLGEVTYRQFAGEGEALVFLKSLTPAGLATVPDSRTLSELLDKATPTRP